MAGFRLHIGCRDGIICRMRRSPTRVSLLLGSRARHVIIAIALCVAPAPLSAQRIANARAGIAASVVLVRQDTTAVDSIAPHRSRAVDAIGGGILGTLIGGVAGLIYAEDAAKHCGDGPCLVGLAIPFFAGIGLVGGTVAGALWPTH